MGGSGHFGHRMAKNGVNVQNDQSLPGVKRVYTGHRVILTKMNVNTHNIAKEMTKNRKTCLGKH